MRCEKCGKRITEEKIVEIKASLKKRKEMDAFGVRFEEEGYLIWYLCMDCWLKLKEWMYKER